MVRLYIDINIGNFIDCLMKGNADNTSTAEPFVMIGGNYDEVVLGMSWNPMRSVTYQWLISGLSMSYQWLVNVLSVACQCLISVLSVYYPCLIRLLSVSHPSLINQ